MVLLTYHIMLSEKGETQRTFPFSRYLVAYKPHLIVDEAHILFDNILKNFQFLRQIELMQGTFLITKEVYSKSSKSETDVCYYDFRDSMSPGIFQYVKCNASTDYYISEKFVEQNFIVNKEIVLLTRGVKIQLLTHDKNSNEPRTMMEAYVLNTLREKNVPVNLLL